jgi:hypothetical protein
MLWREVAWPRGATGTDVFKEVNTEQQGSIDIKAWQLV